MMRHRDISRREFLGASALGLIGLANRRRSAVGGEWWLDDELLYVGTYTEQGRTDGIYLVRFDPRSGALRQVGAVNAGANPSFLAIHPNGRWMYAVNELDQGGVTALAIEPRTGGLTRINEQQSRGSAPCYVSLDRVGRVALVANYTSGSVALLPIGNHGALRSAATIDQHRGTGPVSDRQEGPHAHCIVTDPTNRFALSCDLGADRVFVYRIDARRGRLMRVEKSDAHVAPGSGPRHLAFHPGLPLIYVSDELNSTVTTLRLSKSSGALEVLDTKSTVPTDWKGANYPADIHVAPNGRMLYVSNRGHNSVAVFAIDRAGALTLDQTVSCGGDWPRNFSIDPSGRWIIVANQRSGTVDVLARDPDTGRLSPTKQQLAVPSPSCVRFRAHTGVTA